jgi:hypothetical protein
MATPSMPGRGHATAPKFNPLFPRELRRYFKDVELLCATCGITTDEEKKQQVLRYVDTDTADLWELRPEYAAAHSYEDFKTAIEKLYPGAGDERKWSIADMDRLLGEQLRVGILDSQGLGAYYRSFLTITEFLRSKGRLSEAEQSRAFVRGFQPSLWERIARRLELRIPDHYPDDPYPLDKIVEAAKFVLHGTSPNTFASEPASDVKDAKTPAGIKSEDFTSFLDKFATTLVHALAPRAAGATEASTSASAQPRPPNHGLCNFCGGTGHFMGECPVVEQYTKEGKCRRNVEGKVILNSGAYAPRNLPGTWLRDRIDEWHRRNPGQQTKGHLTSNMSSSLMYEVANDSAPTMMYTANSRYPVSSPPSTASRISALDAEIVNLIEQKSVAEHMYLELNDRKQALETELFALRKKFDGVEILKRPQPKQRDIQADPVVPAPPVREAPVAPVAPVANDPEPVAGTSSAPSADPASVPVEKRTFHPYGRAREPNYLPPQDRNFAGPPPKAPKDKDPAYQVQAPIEDPKIADDVYQRWIKTQHLTVSAEELLSLSSEVRNRVRENVTPKRVPAPQRNLALATTIGDPLPFATDVDGDEIMADAVPRPIVASNAVTSSGSITIADPYETYLKELPANQQPTAFTVAKESHSLRSIKVLVNNTMDVEAILDPGCQIIAMSEEICHELGLAYDPTIVLNMQSANGDVDKSLGLARNVPCRLGTITVYLQIHVIRAAAYDILLGRPFDVLTQSTVTNFANADQTITIRDPNYGRTVTIPTIARSSNRRRPADSEEHQVFRE